MANSSIPLQACGRKRNRRIDSYSEQWIGYVGDLTIINILADLILQDTNRGLQAVSRIAKSLRLEGVYGPLYSLFEVEDRYKTAVEVTAGNRYEFAKHQSTTES